MLQSKKRNHLGKRLLAVLLGAAMTVGSCTCAFAEETDTAAAVKTESIQLSNLRIVSGEQVIDLKGLSLDVDVTGTDEPEAFSLHMDMDGEKLVEIGFTGTDKLAVLHLESPTLGVKDYVIDASVVLSRYMDEGIQSLVGMLQSIDTKAVADGIIEGMNAIGEMPDMPETELVAEAPETELVVAEEMPEVTVEGDIAAVIEECITGPETVELGGTQTGINGEEISVADGTYNKTEFSFGLDTLCKILDMIYVDGEPAGMSDEVRAEIADLQISGSVTKGATDDLNRLADVNVKFDDGKGEAGDVRIAANKGLGENGQTVDVALVVNDKGQSFGFSVSAAEGMHTGEAFTIDSVDMDSAITLTDMEDDAVAEELSNAFSTWGIDVVSTVLAPMMSEMMADADMAEAATEAVAAE